MVLEVRDEFIVIFDTATVTIVDPTSTDRNADKLRAWLCIPVFANNSADMLTDVKLADCDHDTISI